MLCLGRAEYDQEGVSSSPKRRDLRLGEDCRVGAEMGLFALFH